MVQYSVVVASLGQAAGCSAAECRKAPAAALRFGARVRAPVARCLCSDFR